MSETTITQPDKPKVQVPQVVGVGEYAEKLGMPVTRVIAELMKNGVMATINEQIDFDTAAIIGADLGFDVQPAESVQVTAKPRAAKGEGESRPPVVTVMGHVDHGKTSLLDAIRNADVVSGEAGAITQHIGAYQIKRKDRWITFLDTPGHEAFSALRAHGARMTDVAIIVVAADDGVKPQTKEAVKMAREAGVQLVVAINKVDKPGADVNRVKQELSELELVSEDWGGKTVMVEVSAKTSLGVDQLIDMVLLVVDLEDLRARSTGPVEGVVVESHLDSGRGPVVTVLVREGSLGVGDYLVAGRTYGKVRSLEDFRGKRIKQASPGMPAVVTGLKAVPEFGDTFNAVASEKEARDTAVSRQRTDSIKSMVRVKKIDASEISSAITAGRISDLNVVVKADVQGSLESLLNSLSELRNEEVAVKVVHSGVGDVRESDVTLAKTTGAIILGFNVAISSVVKQLATREQVKVQLYKVIYELLDDLRDVLSQMMSPETVETTSAELKILGVFKLGKGNVICGGKVLSGKVEPKLALRVMRGGNEIGRGNLTNLQKDKQEAKAVYEGEECGLSVATGIAIEVGDVLEFYNSETLARRFEG
jgi:translation initiation factor IF-2